MRGIDTNVVVRFLVADDRPQAEKARAVIERGEVFIPLTVMMESEWVLRSGYTFSAARIAAAFRGLGGLPGVTIESPPLVAMALDWVEEGMDFADAIHLLRSEGCDSFLTFDQGLIKASAGRSHILVGQP